MLAAVGDPLIFDRTAAQSETWLLLLAVFAPAILGLLTLVLPRAATTLKTLVSLGGPVVSLILLFVYLGSYGVDHGRVSLPWMPGLNLDLALRADALGAFFALLVAGIGCLICLYGRAYLGDSPGDVGKFFPLITSFMTAMLGLVLSDDLLLMLLFWEMTSVTSFLLIGWDPNDKKSVKNALQAFATTGFGGLALLGGLVWLAVSTDAWAFSQLGPVASSSTVVAAFVLVYGGIAAKSAQWPLHYWLPGAMLAPTPISAYLHSAAMVKAGIYLLARLWPNLSGLEAWPWVIVGFGSITMVLGAWIALQRDVLKQILAYTTISQLGLLACAFGLSHFDYEGEANLVWGNAQILNHALYKAPLFILAGACAHALGIKALSGMTGAWHAGGERKLYSGLFLAAMVALAAVPGTFSFFAKEAFLYQIWHGFKETHSIWLIALLVATVFVSVCNVAILVRFARTFFARSEQEHAPDEHHDDAHHDAAIWHHMLWMPAALLVALQYIGGLFGVFIAGWLMPLEATPFYPTAYPEKLFSLWYVVTHPGVPLLASVVGIIIGVLLGWSDFWHGFRGDVHDRVFPAAYGTIVGGGKATFGLMQTGRLRWYTFATLLVLAGLFLWTAGGRWLALPVEAWQHARDNGDGLPSPWSQPLAWLLPTLICVAAVTMVLIRDRVTRVLVLGTVGFAVSATFYVYAAPDLALTQLSVEIVSLILFLLVLNLLPTESPGDRSFVAPRLVLAVVVGTVVGGVTLVASTGNRPDRVVALSDETGSLPLGDFFLRNSYKAQDLKAVEADRVGSGVVDRGDSHLKSFGSGYAHKKSPGDERDEETLAIHKGGGGGNVVNVILVDFRGFDTFGEIGVLGLAALGVWTLLRKPPHDGDAGGKDNRSDPHEDTFRAPFVTPGLQDIRGDHPVGTEYISSPILKVASRILLPLALMFSAYLFFKGHQTPGGGFVGGLAAAVALIVFRMCFGCQALYKLLPVRERTLIGTGLLLAILTAVVPLLLGLPLLSSNNGYLPLINGGSYHWATVAVFDLGVFLVVVGSLVGMVDALARELE